jgi:hypothetical protein
LALQQALGDAEIALLTIYVRAYIEAWQLTDEAGQAIEFTPWPATDDTPMPDAWARIPEHLFSRLSRKAQTIWLDYWRQRRDPLAEPLPEEPSAGGEPTS